jgi:hypothetical protein
LKVQFVETVGAKDANRAFTAEASIGVPGSKFCAPTRTGTVKSVVAIHQPCQ